MTCPSPDYCAQNGCSANGCTPLYTTANLMQAQSRQAAAHMEDLHEKLIASGAVWDGMDGYSFVDLDNVPDLEAVMNKLPTWTANGHAGWAYTPPPQDDPLLSRGWGWALVVILAGGALLVAAWGMLP